MVAARVHALPKPIKWFCISNLFRGENVQRGRLREFFQWNVDVIGSPLMTADAEVILVGVEALRELGLTQQDFAVHISNRRLVRAILLARGVPESAHAGAYAIMDKAATLKREELARRWEAGYGSYLSFDALYELLAARQLADLRAAVSAGAAPSGLAAAELEAAIADTQALMTILQNFGISEFCKLDLHVVRGLAYYTGPVFEFYDRSARERAVCGGGRYDDLLGKLGKSSEPAVGFGMGDVVLSLLLDQRGLLNAGRRGGDVTVVEAAEGLQGTTHRVVAELRRAGLATDFSYVRQPLAKQLKAADKAAVRFVAILGEETLGQGIVKLKDMAGGQEREISLDAFLADPCSFIRKAP
jgi:histidyl-tRNA synthetase